MWYADKIGFVCTSPQNKPLMWSALKGPGHTDWLGRVTMRLKMKIDHLLLFSLWCSWIAGVPQAALWYWVHPELASKSAGFPKSCVECNWFEGPEQESCQEAGWAKLPNSCNVKWLLKGYWGMGPIFLVGFKSSMPVNEYTQDSSM